MDPIFAANKPYMAASYSKPLRADRSLPPEKNKGCTQADTEHPSQGLSAIDKNREAIFSSTSRQDKLWVRKLVNVHTPPEQLIEAADRIQDKETQQSAWVLIAKNSRLKENIRLRASENILDAILKQNILQNLNRESKENLDPADDKQLRIVLNSENLYTVRFAAAKAVVNSHKRDQAYSVIAQDPELSDHHRFAAAKELNNPLLASEALQKIILDMIGSEESLDIDEITFCIDPMMIPHIKDKTIETLVTVAHRWMDLEDEGEILEKFDRLQRSLTGDNRDGSLGIMIKNVHLSQTLRIAVIEKYIEDESLKNRLIDAIESDELIRFKPTKSANKA